MPQQVPGERYRRRLAAPPAVDGDFLGGAAFLGSDMTAVQVDHRLSHDHAEPDEGRSGRVDEERIDAINGSHPRFLQNVVSVDPASESRIHPEIHHSPQSRTMHGEQF